MTARSFVNSVRRADIVVVPTDLTAATMASTPAPSEVLESQWGSGGGSMWLGVVTNPIAEPDEEWPKFFTDKCAEVVQVPFDPHIATKSVVTWTDMAPSTHKACLQLTGTNTDIYRNRKTEETQS